MSIYAKATHGVVCNMGDALENYFGWPSVAKLDDGTIVAGSSGLRRNHIDPWGKSVLNYSTDNGQTFGEPVIAHNDMIDNRDLGVVALGGQKFAITWFSSEWAWVPKEKWVRRMGQQNADDAEACMATWDKDTVDTLLGSWIKITEDGGKTWTRPIRVPVNAPHGFSVMPDGTYGYLGKACQENLRGPSGPVQYCVSKDGGYTWAIVGTVPIPKDQISRNHETHVIGLDDGTLVGAIRNHLPEQPDKPDEDFLETTLTFSKDGGKTWTEPKALNVAGSPPHLMKHSSGALVLSYGYRHPGFGQRAVVSYDGGQTWSEDIILRDDGNDGDLGYPCSIELDDGSIFTVYYQALPGRKNTSILWTRWELPARA